MNMTFDSPHLSVSTHTFAPTRWLCNKINIYTRAANSQSPKSLLLEINCAADASDGGEVCDSSLAATPIKLCILQHSFVCAVVSDTPFRHDL